MPLRPFAWQWRCAVMYQRDDGVRRSCTNCIARKSLIERTAAACRCARAREGEIRSSFGLTNATASGPSPRKIEEPTCRDETSQLPEWLGVATALAGFGSGMCRRADDARNAGNRN
jgi:hypothetical protein